MAQCASNQFTAHGGILGLSRNAMSRVVLNTEAKSTGDGPVTRAYPAEAQKTLIDQRAHWRSDYDVPVQLTVYMQRARRTLISSNPYFLFIRERHTFRIGSDDGGTVTAPEPTTHPVWHTEWGGGIDLPMAGGRFPFGQFRHSDPAATVLMDDTPVRIEPGQSIDVRFRATLITAYGPENTPDLDLVTANRFGEKLKVEAFANRIVMVAYPEVAPV